MNQKVSEQVLTEADKDIITTAQLSSCTASAAVPSSVTSPRRRILQNHQLIWLKANTDESNDFYQNAITQLQTIVNNVDTFTDPDQCVDCLTGIIQEKVFMIVSKPISEQIIPLIHNIPVLEAIYIFSEDEAKEEEEKLFKGWPKVKEEYTRITPVYEAIRQAIRQCDKNSIPISFVSANAITSDSKLDELDSSFMYTQVFKEILLGAEYNQQSIKDLVLYWRSHYIGNNQQLKNIDEFERAYCSDLSIWWYTRDLFTYGMLNRSLRTMEADIIIKMGFFIRDLHRQLEELHAQQFGANNTTPFTVYRGQGLSKKDFQKLMKTKGGLMSFNNFLSTSENPQLSHIFAESILANPEQIGILFKITIDPSVSSTPYAFISSVSYFKEENEILFSMHSVFRIDGIEQIDNNDRLYQVELKLTADDDQQLRTLTNRIREETYPTEKGRYRMSMLLIKLGQFQQAEEVYMTVEKELSDDTEKKRFYNMLGIIKNGQGDYEKSVFFYEKFVEISEKTLTANDPNLATPYNNIASVYLNKGEHSRALAFFEKALEIRQKALPTGHHLLAISHNNIGGVYSQLGEYSKTGSFYEQTLKIQQEILPENHPDLANSYSNIGVAYVQAGEYSRALSFLDKALRISEKILPQNHPYLAVLYNNTATVCLNMGEYSKGISFYEQELKIQQEVLSPSHPSLATYYSNIGSAYRHVGEYSKALSFHEKALDIRQIALPATHPDFAISYIHIGGIYADLGQYPKAHEFHEKALGIFQITLPPAHPSLATLYGSIALSYGHMKESSKALSLYEKALEISRISLPPNHPDVATTLANIGTMYNDMGEHSKALSFHEQALIIKQATLPSNHPSLAVSYSNIGSAYSNMGEHSKALSFCEKALAIRQVALSPNHPDLANSYNNIGTIYDKLEEYSKALSFYQKAEEIFRKIFRTNHPSMVILNHNIGGVYLGMGEYSKALCIYEKELKILQKTVPENDFSLLTLYRGIGMLYFKLKEYSKALFYSERALQIGEKFLPTNHPDLQIMRNYFAAIVDEL